MRKFIIVILVTGALYLILSFTNLFRVVLIQGNSMLPGYEKGGIHVISKLANFKTGTPCMTKINGQRYFSRIAGLPGDAIELNDGYLLRNGVMVDNPDKVMFQYYIRSNRLSDEKVFRKMKVKPSVKKDSVIFYLTYPEFKEMSFMFFLHRISRDKNGQIPGIYGSTQSNGWNASNYGPVIVPKDKCFLLCDNRDDSKDSRNYGFVPLKDVVPMIF